MQILLIVTLLINASSQIVKPTSKDADIKYSFLSSSPDSQSLILGDSGKQFPSREEQVSFDARGTLVSMTPFQEEQVSFDTKGTLMTLTAQDAKRIGVFQDIKGLVKIEVYKISTVSYNIEILHKENSRLLRTRETINEGEFKALQLKINKLFLAHPKLDRSGWGLFALTSLQSSTTEWAPLMAQLVTTNIIDTMPMDSTKPDSMQETNTVAAAVQLFTSAAGFFIPLALTINKPVTLGQAGFSWSWTHQGYGVGLLLADITRFSGSTDYSKIYKVSALAGGILGDFAGYSFAGRHKLNEGRAAMMAEMGYWGGFYGALVPYLVIPGKFEDWEHLGWEKRTLEAFTLCGLGCGEYWWYNKAKDVYTYGDWLGFTTFAALSAATSMNVSSYLWGDLDSGMTATKQKLYAGTAGAINLLGLWKGMRLFKTPDLTLVDGVALTGGTLAGTLVGAGVMMVTKPEDGKVKFSMGLTGGWAGYLVTNALISRGQGEHSMGLNLQLQPQNLLNLLMSKKENMPFSGSLISINF
ncbi:MAG: hypothetical protein PHE49_00340 [bacterium]|nr:hypothetical protein [bacterium]